MSSHPATRRPHNGATKGATIRESWKGYAPPCETICHTHAQSTKWAVGVHICHYDCPVAREGEGGKKTGQTGSPSRLLAAPPLLPPPSNCRTNDFLIHLHMCACVCEHPKGVKVLPQARIVAGELSRRHFMALLWAAPSTRLPSPPAPFPWPQVHQVWN